MSGGRRCSATSTSTRVTRRSPASSSSAWTAACSSRPSQALEDRVRDLADAHGAALRAVVLDFEAVPCMDSQGSEQLRQILEFVESQNATLRLARVKPEVRAKLERDGLLGRIGGDRVHGNVHRAVEAEAGHRAPLGSPCHHGPGVRIGETARQAETRSPSSASARCTSWTASALAHGRCHPLHRPAPHVAHGEHARDAGLERERPAPSGQSSAPTSSPVARKPWESRSSSGGSHSVRGRAPIRTNSASAETVSSSPVTASWSASRSSRSRRRRR